MNVKLSIEELKELLETAFEEGWSGYHENKDGVVEKLLKSCKVESPPLPPAVLDAQIGPNMEFTTEYMNEWDRNYMRRSASINSSPNRNGRVYGDQNNWINSQVYVQHNDPPPDTPIFNQEVWSDTMINADPNWNIRP